MTDFLYCDFETRSRVDLKAHGLARYALDPSTQMLCFAWALNNEAVGIFHYSDPTSITHVLDFVRDGGLVVAHNAQFELAIWNAVMVPRFKWPRLKPEQVRCTMAACYAMGLPGALENAAPALGLPIKKDIEGRALMLKLCKPLPNGQWYEPPGALERLGQYCGVDVEVERGIHQRVMPLTEDEQALWVLDNRINLRGVPFDMPSLRAALVVADKEKERLDGEMAKVTSGAVAKCSAVGALKEWAGDYGVLPDSLAKAELGELLEEECLPAPVRAALELRRDAGRFTSIAKLVSIEKRQVHGRVPYAFQYHAATTGRWAGRGVQPHNFTRDLPEPEAVEEILRLLREGNVEWLDLAYGKPSILISKCLRGFIKPAEGALFMGGDFSSVESRGIAWLSGEEWKLDAYRECDADPELPDMYERIYAKTFGIDPRAVTSDQRKVGKVEDLAFGYQGGENAFRTMGKNYNVRVVEKITPEAQAKGGLVVTTAQVNEFKTGWRESHPKVKGYWKALQAAAIGAVYQPGTITACGAAGRQVKFRVRGSFLWCRLPSGRTLCYPYPKLFTNDFGPYLTFKGVPDAQVWAKFTGQKERGEANTTYVVDEPGNSKEWCRIATYGGKLSENITQAICRDLLAEAIVRVEAAGYPVVLHVHDEVIVEGIFTEEDRARFQTLTQTVPAWAKDFPIAAGCWLAPRYRKE